MSEKIVAAEKKKRTRSIAVKNGPKKRLLSSSQDGKSNAKAFGSVSDPPSSNLTNSTINLINSVDLSKFTGFCLTKRSSGSTKSTKKKSVEKKTSSPRKAKKNANLAEKSSPKEKLEKNGGAKKQSPNELNAFNYIYGNKTPTGEVTKVLTTPKVSPIIRVATKPKEGLKKDNRSIFTESSFSNGIISKPSYIFEDSIMDYETLKKIRCAAYAASRTNSINKSFSSRSKSNITINSKSISSTSSYKNAADNKFFNHKVIDNKITNSKSTDSKSIDNKSVDSKSLDNKSIDKETKDNKIADSKTADNMSADNKTVNNTTLDNKIADNKTIGNKTADNKTIDNKTEGNKTTDNKTEDDRTVDNKSIDHKIIDNNSTDINKTDSKTMDNNSRCNKSIDNESITSKSLSSEPTNSVNNVSKRIDQVSQTEIEFASKDYITMEYLTNQPKPEEVEIPVPKTIRDIMKDKRKILGHPLMKAPFREIEGEEKVISITYPEDDNEEDFLKLEKQVVNNDFSPSNTETCFAAKTNENGSNLDVIKRDTVSVEEIDLDTDSSSLKVIDREKQPTPVKTDSFHSQDYAPNPYLHGGNNTQTIAWMIEDRHIRHIKDIEHAHKRKRVNRIDPDTVLKSMPTVSTEDSYTSVVTKFQMAKKQMIEIIDQIKNKTLVYVDDNEPAAPPAPQGIFSILSKMPSPLRPLTPNVLHTLRTSSPVKLANTSPKTSSKLAPSPPLTPKQSKELDQCKETLERIKAMRKSIQQEKKKIEKFAQELKARKLSRESNKTPTTNETEKVTLIEAKESPKSKLMQIIKWKKNNKDKEEVKELYRAHGNDSCLELLDNLISVKRGLCPVLSEIEKETSKLGCKRPKTTTEPLCSVSKINFAKALEASRLYQQLGKNQNQYGLPSFLTEMIVNTLCYADCMGKEDLPEEDRVYIDIGTLKQILNFYEVLGCLIIKLQECEDTICNVGCVDDCPGPGVCDATQHCKQRREEIEEIAVAQQRAKEAAKRNIIPRRPSCSSFMANEKAGLTSASRLHLGHGKHCGQKFR